MYPEMPLAAREIVADLASFHNESRQVVEDALHAYLRGERDPLARYLPDLRWSNPALGVEEALAEVRRAAGPANGDAALMARLRS